MADTNEKPSPLPTPKVAAKKKKPAAKKTTKKKVVKKTAKVKAPTALNQTEFAIENGIPVPPPSREAPPSKYPFAALNVGQSFFVGIEPDDIKFKSEEEANRHHAEKKKAVQRRLRAAAQNYRKRNADQDLKFVVRVADGGARVWRVAVEG